MRWIATSLDDLRSLRTRRDMWFPGGDIYLVVCAYLLGAQHAAPALLDGFDEFVSATRSMTTVVGWPDGVLIGGGLTDEQIRDLMGCQASPDLNERAIQLIFDALEDFATAKSKGELPARAWE